LEELRNARRFFEFARYRVPDREIWEGVAIGERELKNAMIDTLARIHEAVSQEQLGHALRPVGESDVPIWYIFALNHPPRIHCHAMYVNVRLNLRWLLNRVEACKLKANVVVIANRLTEVDLVEPLQVFLQRQLLR
jgi:hypothetical protein